MAPPKDRARNKWEADENWILGKAGRLSVSAPALLSISFLTSTQEFSRLKTFLLTAPEDFSKRSAWTDGQDMKPGRHIVISVYIIKKCLLDYTLIEERHPIFCRNRGSGSVWERLCKIQGPWFKNCPSEGTIFLVVQTITILRPSTNWNIQCLPFADFFSGNYA